MTEPVSRIRGVAHEGEEEAVTASSSANVFADLVLPDADELAVKADLGRAIRQLIDARGTIADDSVPSDRCSGEPPSRGIG